MAINPHDDYEALAKLLYPSIEASGNAYYGQTRKLTLDEVLKRNSLGFDSHVESFYENDSYNSYFCWRLGSLHGSIATNANLSNEVTIENFPGINSITRILYASENEQVYDEDLVYTRDNSFIPIFGTIFAKYRIDKSTNEVANLLHSGEYKSYETNLQPIFVGLYVTDDFNPVNSIDDNISDRHFYIAKEDSSYYLYIQILTSVDTNNILTFTALDSEEINKISLHKGVNVNREVHYRINNGLWQSYIFDSGDIQPEPTGSIEIAAGDKIQFTSLRTYANFPDNLDEALRFSIDSGKFFVSGNCSSLIDTIGRIFFSLPQNGFYGLFYGVDHLYGTPVLPSNKNLANSCYAFMFYECASLSVAPKLKEDTLKERCYESMFGRCCSLVSPPQMRATSLAELSCREMFKGCTSLRSTPKLYADTLGAHLCYSNMFEDCKSLKRASCNAQKLAFHEINTDTFGWMNNVPSSGIFTKRKGSSFNWLSGINGIPSNWSVVEEDAEYFTAPQYLVRSGYCLDKCTPVDNCKCDYLVTSGMNSSINGRGDITDSDTITNIENSFDERNRHQMNTYNADGSFNQEIWGYKSFNSPVQFRNGIYGESYSISECANTADEIKAIIRDTQQPSSNPKSVVIEPSTVSSSRYKSTSGYTSILLADSNFKDITATSSNTDIFNMYGVTPTVSESDLHVAGSTADSSHSIRLAATDAGDQSTISVIAKTSPVVYVDRDLDLETYPEYESNGLTIYHNSYSSIKLNSTNANSNKSASILISSNASDPELSHSGINSILLRSNSNSVPHLYSDIILPNSYVVLEYIAYARVNLAIVCSIISDESPEDIHSKLDSSVEKLYLIPDGLSTSDVAVAEGVSSISDNEYIRCICSAERIVGLLHNYGIGHTLKQTNGSYIGTGDIPYNKIYANNMYASSMSVNGATYLENIPSTAFCVEYTLSPITDEDKDAFYDLGNDTTLLRFLHQDIDIGTAKHIVLKTSNNIHCLFSLDGDDSSTGNHYVSFNYTDAPATVVNSAIPIYDDTNEAYGCVFTNAFSKYTQGVYRSLDGQHSYQLKYATYYNGHNDVQINLENCYIYMSQYNKIVVVDTNSSKLYFSDISSIRKVPAYEVGTGTVIYGAIGLDIIFQTEVNSAFNTIRWIKHTDRNNIYVEATNGRCIRIHREVGSWSWEEIKNILGSLEISEFTYDITKYSSVVKRQYTTSGNRTWYLLMTRVKRGIYYIDSDSAILAADECHGSIEDMSYNGFGE